MGDHAYKYCSECLQQLRLTRLGANSSISDFNRSASLGSEKSQNSKRDRKQWFGRKMFSEKNKSELKQPSTKRGVLTFDHSPQSDDSQVPRQSSASSNYERFGTQSNYEGADEIRSFCSLEEAANLSEVKQAVRPSVAVCCSRQMLDPCHLRSLQQSIHTEELKRFPTNGRLTCTCPNKVNVSSNVRLLCSDNSFYGIDDLHCSESSETCVSIDFLDEKQKNCNKLDTKYSQVMLSPKYSLMNEISAPSMQIQNKCLIGTHLKKSYSGKKLPSEIWTTFETSLDMTSNEKFNTYSSRCPDNKELLKNVNYMKSFTGTLPLTNDATKTTLKINSKDDAKTDRQNAGGSGTSGMNRLQNSSGDGSSESSRVEKLRIHQTFVLSLAVSCFFYVGFFMECTMEIYIKFISIFVAVCFLAIVLCKYGKVRKPLLTSVLLSLTKKGRFVYIYLILTTLLSGPIKNGFINMMEMNPALRCLIETSDQSVLGRWNISSNLRDKNVFRGSMQTELLAKIFQEGNIKTGVRDLGKSFSLVEFLLDDLQKQMRSGQLQVHAAQKACTAILKSAHKICEDGLQDVTSHCLNVMEALGKVYHHSKIVLDRINPDRWTGAKNVPHQSGTRSERHNTNDRSICPPLGKENPCSKLSNDEYLCLPSKWTDESVIDAVNSTKYFIHYLKRLITFDILLEASEIKSGNASLDNRSSINLEAALYIDAEYSFHNISKWKAVLSGTLLVLKILTNLTCSTFLFKSTCRLLKERTKPNVANIDPQKSSESHKSSLFKLRENNDSGTPSKYALITSILFLSVISFAFEAAFYVIAISFVRIRSFEMEKDQTIDRPILTLKSGSMLGTIAVKVIESIGVIKRSRYSDGSFIVKNFGQTCGIDNDFLTTVLLIERGDYFSSIVLSNISFYAMIINLLLIILLTLLNVFETKINTYAQNAFQRFIIY